MFGAIAGDVIGSAYEWNRVKTEDFPLFTETSGFTDDSVLTAATAEALLVCLAPDGPGVEALEQAYTGHFRAYGKRYPNAGYGGRFAQWLASEPPRPYRSFGNGSAMRVSPVAYAFGTLDEVLREARRNAAVTHNHPEGIKGAQATAAAIFLARTGAGKQDIRQYIETTFRYDLSRTLADIRPAYAFDESCQRTVPEAIIAFLESESFEDAIRKAVSLGGDADTLACITGSIALPHYGQMPKALHDGVMSRLDSGIRRVLRLFEQRFGVGYSLIQPEPLSNSPAFML